jgi:hypothetical protein
MISRAEQREIGGRFNFSKTQCKAILREVNGSAMNLAPFHFPSTGWHASGNVSKVGGNREFVMNVRREASNIPEDEIGFLLLVGRLRRGLGVVLLSRPVVCINFHCTIWRHRRHRRACDAPSWCHGKFRPAAP